MEVIVIVILVLIAFSALRFVFGFAGKIFSFIFKLVMRLVAILIFLGIVIWTLDHYNVWGFKQDKRLQQALGFEAIKTTSYAQEME